MIETSHKRTAYKKFKCIPKPSLAYLTKNSKRNRLQTQVKLMQDFGGIVRMPTIKPIFSVFDPHYAQHILLDHYQNYPKADPNYEALVDVLGTSIVTSNGSDWKQRRHRMAPHFQPNTIQHFRPLIESLAKTCAEGFSTILNQEKTLNVTLALRQYLLQIGANIFLSQDLDHATIKALIRTSKQLNHHASTGRQYLNYFPLPSILRLNYASKQLEYHLKKILKARKLNKDPSSDWLSDLLYCKDKQGQYLNEETLLSELKTLLTASHESIVHGLSWTWYELLRQPKLLENARSTQQDTSNPYLKQIFLESLRLHPPNWLITRHCQNSDNVDGFFIPEGSQLWICSYAIHRHPLYWEHPNDFNPERFHANSAPNHRFAYLPFGGGPRLCIGMQLALLIGEAFIRELITLPVEIENRHIIADPQVTLGIKNGLLVKKCNK